MRGDYRQRQRLWHLHGLPVRGIGRNEILGGLRAAFPKTVKHPLYLLPFNAELTDLRVPPANRLEKLAGDRAGQYAIRINDQWRICFEWRAGNAYKAEIVDYH